MAWQQDLQELLRVLLHSFDLLQSREEQDTEERGRAEQGRAKTATANSI